jgi:hypothetical protein
MCVGVRVCERVCVKKKEEEEEEEDEEDEEEEESPPPSRGGGGGCYRRQCEWGDEKFFDFVYFVWLKS